MTPEEEQLRDQLSVTEAANRNMLNEIRSMNAQIAVLQTALDPFASLYRYISQRGEMSNLDTTPVTFIHLKNADAAINGKPTEGEKQ